MGNKRQILLIDNYDSFTFNLYQYFLELEVDVRVVRNDQITVEEVLNSNIDAIVISPGPCTPNEAGISCELINSLISLKPILGVCLGHQCIGQALGAKIVPAGEIMHGKSSEIFHDNKGVFESIKNPFDAIRYHSLAISEEDFPESLEITAKTGNGIIMGVRHKYYPVEGVQFHPESILTVSGKLLLKNFLKYIS